MYIEYITPQRVADPNITEYSSKGGDYRPNYLIRTSDWKKVPGHEAINGYHTLSYCWEQSGEIIPGDDGDQICIDKGHHRITKIKKEKLRISNLFCHRKETTETYQVTYNQLLQQICSDFDIEYLWYDKICIDQTNKEEKQREIKQMHRIYSNARYTVALVPEINIDNPKEFDNENSVYGYKEAKYKALNQMQHSIWWKRSWTLEEVMLSTRILVIGRNTHFWSLANIKQETIKENDSMSNFMLGFQEKKQKSVNQVLYYAHSRTSTKEHDKIFALANILHGMTSVDIDYDHDFLTIMYSFYRQLALRDLSILFFGSILDQYSGKSRYATTMSSYNLPSWTGVAGMHSNSLIDDITLGENGFYSIDDSMDLHIRCRSYTIRPTQYATHVFSDDERIAQASKNYRRTINSIDNFHGDETAALDWSQWCMCMTSMLYTHYVMRDAACCSPVLPLSLTELCDECIVLGVLFSVPAPMVMHNGIVQIDYCYLSPIVAKSSTDNPIYKVIGVILLKHFRYFEPRKIPEEFMNEMFEQLGRSEYQDFCIK